jgi:hypothetical protein
MERYIHVTYCDDIREEVGGKHSYMGIYRSKLLVPEMPIVLPKLCIVVSLSTPVNRPFKSLSLSVLQNEVTLVHSEFADSLQADQAKAAQMIAPEDMEQGRLFAAFPIQFAPFIIQGPMKLRIHLIADGEELKGEGLNVELAKSSPSDLEQHSDKQLSASPTGVSIGSSLVSRNTR